MNLHINNVDGQVMFFVFSNFCHIVFIFACIAHTTSAVLLCHEICKKNYNEICKKVLYTFTICIKRKTTKCYL